LVYEAPVPALDNGHEHWDLEYGLAERGLSLVPLVSVLAPWLSIRKEKPGFRG